MLLNRLAVSDIRFSERADALLVRERCRDLFLLGFSSAGILNSLWATLGKNQAACM
jgi:hypothetical protein